MQAIQEDRLKWLETVDLHSGRHNSFDMGVCVMEAVAYIAGEPHSDHPKCVCPIIGNFLRSWNDGLLSDAERNRLLKVLVIKVVGTRSTKSVEQIRAWLCVDWAIRVFTPAWLELVPSLKIHAETLRSGPEISTVDGLRAITPVLVDLKKQAATAWAAARDAAWAAARDTARAAARAAAWDAAWAAARDAAWDALKPTTETLQVSALDLVNRMIAVGR
jgi:hypothetical protein